MSNPRKILIIDDELDVSRLLSVRLRSQGYAPVCHAEGENAVQRAVSEAPDLIILDIGLPGISGTDLYKYMRDRPETRQIPVLFFSADLSQKAHCLSELGADGFIQKPYNSEDVLQLIQGIFAKTARAVA